MKKITKNSFSKKIAKYSALSLAIAGVADASGQIIYTDVDPDFVGGLGDNFAIDFDSDGFDDINVIQSNNGNYELVKAQPAAGNGVIAASNAGYFYASNVAYGSAISAGAGSFRSFGSFCAGVGYAGSQFCGLGEGYIGVEFDISGDTHYGWVRVDIADSSNFIVLDYAYESTAGDSLNAGEQDPLAVEDFATGNFNYFVDSNNQLNLSSSNAMENVSIHNIIGQQITSQKLVNAQETMIDMSTFDSGLYLVTVEINGIRKTFRVVRK